MTNSFPYHRIALGGTFDHFHIGHKAFLSFAASKAPQITIGITSDAMVKSKDYPNIIQPYQERKQSVEKFFRREFPGTSIEVVELKDVYGPTITEDFDAVIVTPVTQKESILINIVRQKRGLKSLAVEVCELVTDLHGTPFSSTRIRKGDINREGFIYSQIFKGELNINDEVKKGLRLPFGEIVRKVPNSIEHQTTVLVGDVTAQAWMDADADFSIAIIDGLSKRSRYANHIPANYSYEYISATNQKSTINSELVEFFKTKALTEHRTIYRIEGEEDMLAVGLILSLPLESTVVYGYPFEEEGMILVTVTEEIKERLRTILI